MVLFDTLAEAGTELFGSGFVHDKPWSIDLNHKLENPTFTGSSTLNNAGAITMLSSASFKAPSGASVTGSINLDGNAIVTAMYPTPFMPGLKLSCNAKSPVTNKAGLSSLDLTAELKRDPIHVKGVIRPLLSWWSIQTCGTFEVKDKERTTGDTVSLGYEVNGKTEMENLKASAGVRWNKTIKENQICSSLLLTPMGKSPLGKVALAVVGKSPATVGSSMGAMICYVIPEDRTEMSLAASWSLDPAKKTTSLKAMVDHEGRIAGAIKHKLSSTVCVTVGAQFDATKKFSGSESSTKVGFKLQLTA